MKNFVILMAAILALSYVIAFVIGTVEWHLTY